MFNDASPDLIFLLKLAVAAAMIVVSAALGWVVSRQAKEYRGWRVAGWIVGLAALFLFEMIAQPMRARLNQIECKAERSDRDAYQSCLAEGGRRLSDDRVQ